MSCEAIAKSLVETSATGGDAHRYPNVNGVAYTFPHHELESASYNMPISEIAWKNYESMKDLMVNEPLADNWKEFIVEADAKARINGVNSPVDIISASYLVSVDFQEEYKKQGGEPFPEHPEIGPDYSDKEGTKKRVDFILNNSNLRQKLFETTIVHIPDRSPSWLDFGKVASIINQNPGVVIDIGCGVGQETVNHQYDLTGSKVIGIDRQYHPRWYDAWTERENEARFARADAANSIPFADNSIDYAVMEFVVHHINEESLVKIVAEAQRVLKPGGVMFVGPQQFQYQDGTGDGYWRAYKKSNDLLEGISLRDLK